MNGLSFGHDWPWLGSLAAVLLLFLLFGTTRLQADVSRSRWRDRTWLAWAAVLLYLVHNIEEYGVDLLGQVYAFPAALSAMFAGAAQPPNSFYMAVNIGIVWLALPIAALLSRRHPLIGLAGYSVMAINLLTHVGGFFKEGYNPGLLTAVVLFLPATVWMARTLFGAKKMAYAGLAVVIFNGVLVHVILAVSMLSYIHGYVSAGVLVAVQLVNAVLLLAIPWVGERVLGERLHGTA